MNTETIKKFNIIFITLYLLYNSYIDDSYNIRRIILV